MIGVLKISGHVLASVLCSLVLVLAFVPATPQLSGVKQAYAASNTAVHKVFLKKMKNVSGWGGYAGYTFMNIDGDKADEAIAEYSNGGSGKVLRVFDCKGGKARCIYSASEYGALSWIKCYRKTKTLVVWGASHGREWFSYLKLRNGRYKETAYRSRESVKGGVVAQNGSWEYSVDGDSASKRLFKRTVSKLLCGTCTKTSVTGWKTLVR